MTIDDYLTRRYTTVVRRDSDDQGNSGFVARVAELPGCVAQGATRVEALENLDEAMRAWLEVAVSRGAEIPVPKDDSQYSGRVLLRLPASLHAELARAAEAEGVSLNQFMVGALAAAVRWLVPETRAVQPDEASQYEYDVNPAPKYYYYSISKGHAADQAEFLIGEKKEPLFSYSNVDALPLNESANGKLKAAGVKTVGDLVNKALMYYGVNVIGDK